MALVLTDKGAEMILGAYFNNTWPAGGKNLTMKLFATNVTPTDTLTAGSFTEAAGGGYAAKTLANGSWTIETGVPRDALFVQQTWTFTGPLTTNLTIYGYYVVDADNNLIFAELLGASFTPNNNGDQLLVTPKFQASEGTPS